MGRIIYFQQDTGRHRHFDGFFFLRHSFSLACCTFSRDPGQLPPGSAGIKTGYHGRKSLSISKLDWISTRRKTEAQFVDGSGSLIYFQLILNDIPASIAISTGQRAKHKQRLNPAKHLPALAHDFGPQRRPLWR
jgi:hypothetical protein